jgi:hypothetical protein
VKADENYHKEEEDNEPSEVDVSSDQDQSSD